MTVKWVEWQEPDNTGDVVTVYITTSAAIKQMKESAARQNYIYESDEQALDDFLTTYWAKIIE